MVMLATKDVSHPFELDSIVAWFVLNEVAVGVPIMLWWAPALRGSKARSLVKMWSVMVFVGAICGYVNVRWTEGHVDKRSCHEKMDHSMSFMKSDIFLGISSKALLGRFDIAAIAAALMGLWTNLRPAKLWISLAGSSAILSLLKCMDLVVLLFASVVLVVTIVLHELYLLRAPRLPMLLPVTSYEQWNCWVAAGLIVGVTVLNWMLGYRKGGTSQQEASWQSTSNEGWIDQQQHGDPVSPHTSSRDPWSVKLSGWQPGSAKLWSGGRTDLEWAGVVGKPMPSHIG